jgi:hypothetical protein
MNGIGRKNAVIWICVCLTVLISPAYGETIRWDQDRLQTVLESEINRVERMGQNPILVEAVMLQNAEGLTLDVIQKRDEAWKNSDDADSFKQAMLASMAGKYLSNLMKSSKAYTEVFLTDNQGANVAASPLTSDYWQGDEDKWAKAFTPEGGAVFVGSMEWDESSGYNAVQISVPVKQEGAVIGVMVVGVKLSHVLAKQLQEL